MRPSPVKAIEGFRRKSAPPRSRSNAPMAVVSEGCETPQRRAAQGEIELLAQRQEVTDLVHLHWSIASRFLSSASATPAAHPPPAPMAGPATCLKRFSLRLYAHVTPLKLNP